MAFIPAVNTAELSIHGLWAGQVAITTFNFLFPGAIATEDLQELATTATSAWITNIQPHTSSEYGLVKMRAVDLTTASSPAREDFPAEAENGAVGERSVAVNSALVISMATALRGKSFRGRIYVAGIPVGATVSAALMSSAGRDFVVNDYTSFVNDIEEAMTIQHVVVSRYTGGAARAAAVMTPIISYSANTALDSMRSRLEGRGT